MAPVPSAKFDEYADWLNEDDRNRLHFTLTHDPTVANSYYSMSGIVIYEPKQAPRPAAFLGTRSRVRIA
jgi:hypothetical protein